MDHDRTLFLLALNAFNLYIATLISGPKWTTDLFNELKDPKPGDLVIENTSFFIAMRQWDESKNVAHIKKSMGRLHAIAYEPICPEEERENRGYTADEKIPEEKVFYLDALNGERVRWTNANFIKVIERWLAP